LLFLYHMICSNVASVFPRFASTGIGSIIEGGGNELVF